MPEVIDLFTVVNGIQVTDLSMSVAPSGSNNLPVLRPSHSFRKLIAGFTALDRVSPSKIFPADSLIVSTNGEGSHSYSYVIPYLFTANSDVSVLVPNCELSLKEKIYYAAAITATRWRFSYGRKPKGKRLETLELPIIPRWVKTCDIPDLGQAFQKGMVSAEKDAAIKIRKLRPISELFTIQYGNSYELNRMEPDARGVAFVSRTSRNNGISARVAQTEDKPSPAGSITVALGGAFVLEAFLQSEATYQGRDVAVLAPIKHMTVSEKLWYVTAIRQHRFRFSWGRQANRQLPDLKVPECPESIRRKLP